MLRILIADDHEIVRRGIRQILQEEFSFAQIEEAFDTDSLINKALSQSWDIIVSDLAMPGGGGLEALLRIREKTPETPVLILSIYPEEQYALRVIKAGASGYLNKDAAPEQLVTAVQRVLSGKRYLTLEVTEQFQASLNRLTDVPPHKLLSERELDVMLLIVSGSTITEIAQQLSLGITTISTYRSRILQKMDVKSNAELIQYAVANALI